MMVKEGQMGIYKAVLTLCTVLTSGIQSVHAQVPAGVQPANIAFNWVYLDVMYYWISPSTTDYNTAYSTCSQQTGHVRLAVLDQQDHLDSVSVYLRRNHRGVFWIDATRPAGTGNYTWGNGCPLSINHPAWYSDHQEPTENDTHVVLLTDGVDVTFRGVRGIESLAYRPLCQSVTPPPLFGQYPPSLTWISILGEEFGFSNESAADYTEAQTSCRRQEGGGHLADLDQNIHFSKVAEHVRRHLDTTYWVGAHRESTNAQFTWTNKQLVDPALFAPASDDGPDYTVAGIRYDQNYNTTHLFRMSTNETTQHYLCQRGTGHVTSDPVTLEWTTLDTLGDLFGFSNVTTDLDSARYACARHAGDVKLADLHDTFAEVKNFVAKNFPERQYWVDATYTNDTYSTLWSNGEAVQWYMWALDARSGMHTIFRTDGLVRSDRNLEQLRFICRGKPAYPPADTQTEQMFNRECTGVAPHTLPYDTATGLQQTSTLPSDTTISSQSTENKTAPSTDSSQFTENETAPSTDSSQFRQNETASSNLSSQSTENENAPSTDSSHSTESETAPSTSSTISTRFTELETAPSSTNNVIKDSTSEDSLTTATAELNSYADTTHNSGAETGTTTDAAVRETERGSTETSEAEKEFTTPGQTSAGTSGPEVTQSTTASARGVTLPSQCYCRCTPQDIVPLNTSVLELQEKVKAIKETLTLDKRNLSTRIRKKSSAVDHRVSSQAIGVLGFVLVALAYGWIFILDLGAFVQHLCKKCTRPGKVQPHPQQEP